MHIGIDLMGSDRGPLDLFPAVLAAVEKWSPHVSFVVIATPRAIEAVEEAFGKGKVRFISATEVIEMSDEPLKAVRQKKEGSLMVGLRLLRKKKIAALITAGNTGALIAGASLSLAKLPGIKRPALLATLPTAKGPVSVIDVGGSVQVKASYLVQNAQLGQDYHRKAYHIPHPTLGLLNVGQESKKGTQEHREAFSQLTCLEGFMGNIEPRELFSGKVDVLVTDGFTGNVLLKTAEGVADFIFKTLAAHSTPEMQPALKTLYPKFNWVDYPGAFVLGVEGLLIKCHGSSTHQALFSGIKGAVEYLTK